MAEKTAPQYNSHISCSAGKISFTVIFSRERDAGRGVEGEREGAGNSTIQPFPEVNMTIKILSLLPGKKTTRRRRGGASHSLTVATHPSVFIS